MSQGLRWTTMTGAAHLRVRIALDATLMRTATVVLVASTLMTELDTGHPVAVPWRTMALPVVATRILTGATTHRRPIRMLTAGRMTDLQGISLPANPLTLARGATLAIMIVEAGISKWICSQLNCCFSFV